MLVLTRKPGQSIYIGDEVKITLKDIKGNQIRVGIEAPPSVKIYREEIYQQIMEENQSAAALSAQTPTDLGGVMKACQDQKSQAVPQIGKHKDESEE